MPPSPDASDSPIPGPSPTATPVPSLRLAIGNVASLDPRDLDTPDALLLASQLFDGLVEYDPDTAEVLPAAAETWEVLEGGRTHVFRLREGATFHDGTPVTADSFVTAWNRLADPLATKPFAFLLESVQGFQRFQEDLAVTRLSGVEASTPRVLEVRLNRSWPDFVALLAHPALSPVPGPSPAQTFGTQPVGNGPYSLVGTLTPGSPIRLRSHLGYYGPPPPVAAVEYRPFEAPEDAWPEFLGGELELAEIPAGVLNDATSRFGSQGVATLARALYCGFNEDDERFADRDLRTAVSLGIDREEVLETVYARIPEAATGLVPSSIPGHSPAVCGDRCAHDPARAQALIRDLPRRERTFSLDYAASLAGDRLAAQLAAQLREVGFRVTPRPHLAAEYESVLEEGEHEMFCLVWVADYPRQQAFLEPLLSSDSVDNHGGIEDPRLDALLEEARTTADDAARQRLYVDSERMALTAMHVVPIVWFRSHLATQDYVDGLAVDPLGRYDVAGLSISSG